MPKVLRILNRFNVGGPVYNASYLTADLSEDFETLLIGGPHEEGEGDALYIPESLGLKVRVINAMQRTPDGKIDLLALKEIRSIMREFKPDIVHTHAAKAGALGRIAAKLEGVPIVVHTFHGHVFHSYFGLFKTWIYKNIERFLARITTKIVVISEGQQCDIVDRFRICGRQKTCIIPLGFDLDRFAENRDHKRKIFREELRLEDDETAVALIGRLAPIKNHAMFIRAARATKGKKIRYYIIGDGTERLKIQHLCDELGVSYGTGAENTDVVFLGWISDLDRILPGFDIIALTSLNEGTPVSLIEAQAAGLPVVSTDAGGVRDVVLHEQSGFIVDTLDDDGFVSHLVQLHEDCGLRFAMGKLGQQHVLAHFGRKRLAADTKRLYLELLHPFPQKRV